MEFRLMEQFVCVPAFSGVIDGVRVRDVSVIRVI